MTPCYRCRHVKPPEFPSKFKLWCNHPDKLRAPCTAECDQIDTEAGTDEAEEVE